MTRSLERRRDVLQARHGELVALVSKSALSGTQVESYLESAFRLAVSSETPGPEALTLLALCRRVDPQNPRYAFHTARLYFAAGALETAREWLRAAYQLAPTSHRIWAHIVQLQWALNRRIEGDPRYDAGVLRDCADGIVAAMRGGADALSPKLLQLAPIESAITKASAGERETAPTPVTDARGERSCRWSGIDHLVLERMLASHRSQSTVDAALPLLEQIAHDAPSRRGGIAGFAILAVEWLVLGYPPASIRRLISIVATHSQRKPLSFELVEFVVHCFELPVAEVSAELVLAVVVGKLPVGLAALIHRRRVLHAQIVFSGASEYRAAQALLAAPSSSDPKEDEIAMRDTARRLDSALDEYDPAPPSALDDVTPTAAAPPVNPGAIAAELARLQMAAQVLESARGRAFAHARTLVALARSPAGPTERAQVAADRVATEAFTRALEATAQAALAQLDALAKAIERVDPGGLPEDIAKHVEDCANAMRGCTNLGNFGKKLREIDQALGVPPEPGTPTPLLDELLQIAQTALGPASSGAPAGAPVVNAAAIVAELVQLQTAAQAFESARARAFTHTRTLVALAASPEGAPGRTQAGADRVAIEAFARMLETAARAGLAQLDALSKAMERIPPGALPEDIATQVEDCANVMRGCTNLGNFGKKLRDIDRVLGMPPAPGTPTPLLNELFRSVQTALGPLPNAAAVADAGPVVAPSPRALRPNAGPADALRERIRAVEAAVVRRYQVALASLLPYPRWLRETAPFRELLLAIDLGHAEALRKLGLRDRALAIWNHALAGNRLDVRLLNSRAVCLSTAGDRAEALGAWREYLSALYFIAASEGDCTRHGAERIAIDRALGSSYAPTLLLRTMDPSWKEQLGRFDLLPFIDSATRVRHFAQHKLLEVLNQRLVAPSPFAVLGILPSDSEETALAARDRALRFVDVAAAHLQFPHADLAADLFKARIESALAELKQARGRAVDDSTTKLVDEHIESVSKIAHLKLRLYVLCDTHARVMKLATSIEAIEHLLILDELPLDTSPAIAEQIAGAINAPVPVMIQLARHAVGKLLEVTLEFLFTPGASPSDRVRQAEIYRHIATRWPTLPAVSELLAEIDGARPPTQDRHAHATSELADEMRDLHERYPRFSGVTLEYAAVLRQLHRDEEAIQALARTSREGLSEAGRTMCTRMRLNWEMHRAYDNGKVEDAYGLSLQVLALDDTDEDIPATCAKLFGDAGGTLSIDTAERKLREAIAAWQARARKRLAEWQQARRGGQPPITEAAIAELDEVVAAAVTTAKFHRLVTLVNGRGGLGAPMPSGDPVVTEILALARYVATNSTDKRERDQANNVLKRSGFA